MLGSLSCGWHRVGKSSAVRRKAITADKHVYERLNTAFHRIQLSKVFIRALLIQERNQKELNANFDQNSVFPAMKKYCKLKISIWRKRTFHPFIPGQRKTCEFPLKWSQHVNQRLHFFLSSNDEPFNAKHTLLHIKHVFRLWNICKHIICKCVCGTALFKKYFSIWKCTETAKEVEKIVCISRKRKFMANRFERTHLNSKCILYFPKTLFFSLLSI